MHLLQFLTTRWSQLVMFGFDNSGHNWYTRSRQLRTQLIHMKQTTGDTTDTHEADNWGRNWYTWSRQLRTQLIHTKQTTRDGTDTHEADNSGRNWYTWSRQLGTQLTQFLDRGTQLVLPRSFFLWPRSSDLALHYVRRGISISPYLPDVTSLQVYHTHR